MVSAREPKGLRIFIVEDHSDSLSALETYLSECGHVVRHARTLADTEERLSQNSCDVLLSDIGLPDGDGWELLDRLRKAGTLPKYAIAMSGFGMFTERRKSKAAGYRRHLIKPLNPDDLDAALAEAQGELSSGG